MFSATGRKLIWIQRTLGSFPQRSLGNCLQQWIQQPWRQSVLLSAWLWVSRARNTFCERKYLCGHYHDRIIVLSLVCWHVCNNTDLYFFTSELWERNVLIYTWMCSVRRSGLYTGNQYRRSSGPIWLDNVDCTGSETHFTQCSHNGWGTYNCGHYQDVSISCSSSSSYHPG